MQTQSGLAPDEEVRKRGYRNGILRLSIFAILIVKMDNSNMRRTGYGIGNLRQSLIIVIIIVITADLRKIGYRNRKLRLSIFANLIVKMDNSEYAQIRPSSWKSALNASVDNSLQIWTTLNMRKSGLEARNLRQNRTGGLKSV
jgi:hypothetical protein